MRGSHSAASSGCDAQRRHRRVGHRDRTAVPGLDLREHVEQRGARRRARPAAARATAARAARDARPRRMQLVPRGMELDLVDAVPEAVVRAQDRAGSCWRAGPTRSPRRRPRRRAACEPLARPARALALDRLARGRGRWRRDRSPRAAAAGSAPRGSAAWRADYQGRTARKTAPRNDDGAPGRIPGSPSMTGGRAAALSSGTRRWATRAGRPGRRS